MQKETEDKCIIPIFWRVSYGGELQIEALNAPYKGTAQASTYGTWRSDKIKIADHFSRNKHEL